MLSAHTLHVTSILPNALRVISDGGCMVLKSSRCSEWLWDQTTTSQLDRRFVHDVWGHSKIAFGWQKVGGAIVWTYWMHDRKEQVHRVVFLGLPPRCEQTTSCIVLHCLQCRAADELCPHQYRYWCLYRTPLGYRSFSPNNLGALDTFLDVNTNDFMLYSLFYTIICVCM